MFGSGIVWFWVPGGGCVVITCIGGRGIFVDLRIWVPWRVDII